MNALEILKNLMLIPSASGEEEKVCEYVFKFLTENGFETKKYTVNDGRFNIVASLKPDPVIYFQAHLDTVSPFIEFSEDNENIYGRGSCDTKGSAAAMITAAIQGKEKGFDNFGLIFTVGEEDLLDGAKKLSDELEIPFVVVGEPTSLDIVNQHFGLLVIKAVATGKAAHSSRPEEGINAIDLLLEFVNKIKTIDAHPKTLMSLNVIKGGVADNIIPENSEALYSFRISPEDQNNYPKLFSELTGDKIKLDIPLNIKSVSTNVPKELDFITTRRGVRYFTELSMFGKGVVIGPGDIKYAHGPDEQISKEELNKAVEIYSQIIENFS